MKTEKLTEILAGSGFAGGFARAQGAEDEKREKGEDGPAEFKNIRIKIKGEGDTALVGRAFAACSEAGDVIALIGDLGTGKTTLTKSIAEALGIKADVTSPTFTVVQEYRAGRLPLFHFDLYRVNDEDELFEIGAYDYLEGNGLSIVEWADLCFDIIPEGSLVLKIEYGSAPDERVYELSLK